MKKITKILLLLMATTLVGCIGTDVVEDIIVNEQLSINSRLETLAVGDTYQFRAEFFDELGERVDANVSWASSDETVLTINDAGLATGISEGMVLVRGMSGAARDSLMVTVGTTTNFAIGERQGSFTGLRDYTVNGTFTLTENGDNLELVFSSNFSASNGPGLFVFLSNSATRTNGGVEVGRLQQNSGTQTYIISRDMAELDTYNHVIIYCKPFGVAFGTGEFDN